MWQAATAEERKSMLRLVVRGVALDQKRERGLVWMPGFTHDRGAGC